MLLSIFSIIFGCISFVVYCCIVVGSRYDHYYDDLEQQQYLAQYLEKKKF